MKVKVLKPFFDVKEQVNRHVGEVFECTSARFFEIASILPDWVEEVKEAKPKAAAKKKTATKKAE